MRTFGITGGIGSGKSIVSQMLRTLGIPVFDSDQVAKELTASDPEIRQKLTQLLGETVYTESGYNRAYVASRIFKDDQLRSQVNEIIHPRVRKAFRDFVEANEGSVVGNEAAILIETGAYKTLDTIVLVTAPEAIRVKRVVKRDGAKEQDVRARIEKQWSDAKKKEHADFVLINDGQTPLLKQVENLYDYLISSQSSKSSLELD